MEIFFPLLLRREDGSVAEKISLSDCRLGTRTRGDRVYLLLAGYRGA